MKHLLLICALFLSLASCYSPVPLTLYKDSYRDRQAEDEENEFLVVTKGNHHTSVERVQDYALLRAAQLMKKERYKYFVVSKEVQDFAVGKQFSTVVGQGYSSTGVVDVRNPVVGLIITGHNEEPKLEDKRAKIYSTVEVLEEFDHYVDEKLPKEFDAVNTASSVLLIGLIVWLFTI
jgi:hypothetical protein